MSALKHVLRAHLFKDSEYWHARGDRAIARSLVTANTSLVAKRAMLETSRSTIRILAAMPGQDDAWRQRLGDQVARYFTREAKLARCVSQLGRRLSRCGLTL